MKCLILLLFLIVMIIVIFLMQMFVEMLVINWDKISRLVFCQSGLYPVAGILLMKVSWKMLLGFKALIFMVLTDCKEM